MVILKETQKIINVSVLYVDDDVHAQRLMQGWLKGVVAKFMLAKNGKEGLELFLKHKPDILIADIMMPKMNGLEMVKKIGKEYGAKIFITSAFPKRDYLIESIDVGIDGFLIKPIDFKKLEEYIHKAYKEISLKKQTSITNSSNNIKEIFKNSLVGLLQLNKNGNILWANKALYKMLGYSSLNELIETVNVKDLYISKEESKRIVSFLEDKGAINGMESKWNTKENKIIYVKQTLHRTENEDGEIIYIGTVENITHQKRAELKFLRFAIEYKNLINNANIPIIGIDKYGEINDWNTAANKLLLYTKEEVIGKKIVDLLFNDKDKLKINKAIEDTINKNDVTGLNCRIKTKRNKVLKVLLSTTLKHDYFSNISGVMITIQDITEIESYKLSLEKKIEERTAMLKLALEKEKELGALKSRFVAMTSHEFRTPLTAINFAAGFLKKYDNQLNETQKTQKLSKIEQQVKHMTKMLEDVLHVEKINANKEELKASKIKFADFILPVIDEVYQETKKTHKINLTIDKEDTVIYIDPEKGRIIFYNLLLNAIKYSPQQNQISVHCYSTKHHTFVEVIDSGMGIKESDLEFIYDSFFRGENVETIQGTGLGLAIVKDLVEQHRGKISVKTEYGKGSVFTVKLPLKQ